MVRTLVALATLAALAAPAFAADGADLYDKRCKTCHSIGGAGGPMAKMGGPLDDAGSKHDAAWLEAFIKDPKSKMPNAKMPKVTLNDEELKAVVAYMQTLKGK